MKRFVRPVALFACLTASTAVGAQIAAADTGSGAPQKNCSEQGHHRHDMRHGFFKKIAKQLGLNEQQKSQGKAILEASRAQNKPYLAALMTERHNMRNLMLSGTADEAAIRAQSAKVAAAQADLAVQKNNEAKQLLALLTPDQVTKLKGILDKREQKFRNFMSHDDAE